MRKYFTRRCIGLHALLLVLVPAFLLAGWWQYHVALSGNDLGWVYTVEWPTFAVYAVYVWWRLIHDQTTPFDKLWAAKQRSVADESGTPVYQIPGWARDKALLREVTKASMEAHADLEAQASLGAAATPALSEARPEALELPLEAPVGAAGTGFGRGSSEAPVPDRGRSGRDPSGDGAGDGAGDRAADEPPGEAGDDDELVIDTRVLEVREVVDEELEAYNRYLFELSLHNPPKRWGSSRARRRREAEEAQASSPPSSPPERQAALPPGETGRAGSGS